MLDYLVDLVSRLRSWGYLIIFALATMESAVFLGLFIPGETVVVAAGFMAAQHVLDLDAVIVTAAGGAALGDSIGFELGRRLGRPWAERQGSRLGVTAERLMRGEAFFSRHVGKAVLLGRFVHFARVLVPFVAGSARLPYATFVTYNVLGATLWASSAALLGYFFGQLSEKWLGRASAIVGGIAFVAFALTWLWYWVAEHGQQVKDRWAHFRQRPPVAVLLQEFAPQIAWLRRRLSPGEYFGLQLTLGVLFFTGAAWLFGGITQDVIAGDPLTVVDQKVAVWFERHANPGITAVMSAISWLHTWPIALAGVAFLAYLARKRLWRWSAIVFCAVAGGVLMNIVVKLAVHRERPTLSALAAALKTYSFPSGHTLAATVIYGVIAAYLISSAGAWRRQVSIGFAAFFIVVLAAFSRVYLGVHYLSDVLAAMAEGVAWLALSHIAVNTLWHRLLLKWD